MTSVLVSAFLPTGGACLWERIDVRTDARALVASFAGVDCRGARVAFSPDLRRALVWFDPRLGHSTGYSAPGAPPPAWPDEAPGTAPSRMYVLDLSSLPATPRAVAWPRAERPASIGWRADGPHAYVVRELTADEVRAGRVDVDGTAVVVHSPNEGLPALALAWREDGGRWTLVETADSSTGWDYAAGESALERARDAGPTSVGELRSTVASEDVPPEVLLQLAAVRRSDDERDGWRKVPGIPAFTWFVTGEFTHATGQIRFLDGGAVATPPGLGWTGGELAALQVRDGLLLVAGDGAGTHPRVYDPVSRRLLWSSDEARAAHFWPAPTATPGGVP